VPAFHIVPRYFTRSDDALLRVGLALRVLLAVLVVTTTLLGADSMAPRAWLAVAIGGVTTGATLHVLRRWTRVGSTVELSVCAIAIVATGGPDSVLAPLLIAPAFAAGVAGGLTAGVLLPSLASVGVIVGTMVAADAPHRLPVATSASQWAALGILLGFLGAWAAKLNSDSKRQPPYATAHRLLSELRAVTRQLPSGLDSRTIASHMLDELFELMHVTEGSVFVRGRADHLVVIAHRAEEPPTIPLQAPGRDPAGRARASQQPTLKTVEMPLVVGDRELGVVSVTGDEQSFPSPALVAAAHLVQSMATQLDAALMFDEVRELATVEERHRLARTIHDGIAQELVSVSYALDNALGEPDRDVMSSQIVTARGELRRVLGELRLSIYELRSDKRSTVSLATALSAYVHSIGRDWGMKIHVSATESGARLSSECEAELLRIGQEALTNARKHAAAENIWVTLAVDAPHAWLRIEDDGTGFADAHSAKSFGLHIMRERAARIGATFRIVRRPTRGTLVEVVLGRPTFADASLQEHPVPA
jgi:signal transduction histidine kinase